MIKEEALANGSNFPQISLLILISAYIFVSSVSVPAERLLEALQSQVQKSVTVTLTFPEYFSSIPNLRGWWCVFGP